MTRATALRRIIGIIAVALVISTTAGSAWASQVDPNSRDFAVQQPAPSIARTGAPTAAGSSFDWGYIAIGSSAIALVLAGACVAATTRRRRALEDKTRRPITS